MRLRVVTYNVHGFRAGADRVAGAAAQLGADVLLLQESGGRGALRRFARALGVDAAADPLSPFRRRVKNAVLVRRPWRIVSHRLHRFGRSARFSPRGALVAELGRSGRRLWAVSVHLGLHPGERVSQARELTELCGGLGGPIVIGGDVNEGPDGRAATWIGERYRDAFAEAGRGGGETFPSLSPSARIDDVFVSDGPEVRWAIVPGELVVIDASDHRPVVVELELGEDLRR